MTARGTGPSMTTVFHAKPSDRFMEIQSNLRRKKLFTVFVQTILLGIPRLLLGISLTNDKSGRIFSDLFINFIMTKTFLENNFLHKCQ